MADDIFSRLFELFNQPGPINWKLAEEVAKHLAGEKDIVDPWSAEEIAELARLAEFHLERAAPFPVAPAPSVQVVDRRAWVDLALRRLAFLAEPISESVGSGLGALGSGISGSITGLQIGSIAGAIAASNVASFEAGVPLVPADALLVIGPAVDGLLAEGGDPHQVRLWVAAQEVAHRALFSIPWLPEHFGQLLGRALAGMMPSPEKLGELLASGPATMADPERLAALFDQEHVPGRAELAAFLAISGGYRRHLVERALGEMLTMDYGARLMPAQAQSVQFGTGSPLPSTAELTPQGLAFCREAERRFGREAVDSIWDGPDRLPTSADLDDPVGWAARVLLDSDLEL